MPDIEVLLVEDDPGLGFVIRDNLELAGYRVTVRQDGESGLAVFKKIEFDLCILDVMLPKLDGFSLAREIRRLDHDIPILMLTAKTSTEDKHTGFQCGADDYIVKPFDLKELLYRIQVFLKRRNGHDGKTSIFDLGAYHFEWHNLQLKSPDHIRNLTQKEGDILKLLCQHQGKLLKRETILQAVWGDDDYFMGRSLDVFISRLRKHLSHDPRITISNRHGIGFQLNVATGIK